jgi:hypothetical protein
MATEKRTSAARRSVTKAQEGAQRAQTLTHLPPQTRRALGEEVGKVRRGEAVSRKELEEKARRLGIAGRSRMGKQELWRAVARAG